MHTPTPEQLAIIDAARSSADNLLVSALAGAAKTSTLVMLAEALPDIEILCLAFNKKVAVEMQERLPANCKAMTLNSLGHRTWSEATGRRIKIVSSKTYDIVKALIEEQSRDDQRGLYDAMGKLMRLVDFGKACGYIPTGTHDRAKRLMDDEDFFLHLEQKLSPLEHDIIRGATLESLKQALQGTCDFNDQILMPTIFHGAFPRYPLVLVDEAQDLSALNHATLRKLCKKRLIAVGDPCQPLGTKIIKVSKKGDRWSLPQLREVFIEDIQVGDTILGHNANGSFMYNRRVEGITRRSFDGDLVVAGPTRYTPNHICYTRFASLSEHWCVYMMKKGDAYRVGKARMSYGEQGLGPQIRAKAEGADSMWILSTYETEEAAFIAEAIIQTEFGLGDLCFVDSLRPWLTSFWAEISTFNLEARAAACLNAYHKDINYPLWEIGDSIPVKRPFLTRACNLLNGGELLPYNDDKITGKRDWISFSVSYEPYSGDVISFSISDNHLYVADGIVTHNCQAIYGFRGAHEDSMEKLRETFEMRELPLTISFRCPQAVVEHVRWRAPAMRWPDWARPGTVRTLTHWSAQDLEESATIICRNNAPLFGIAIRLLKNGRTCQLDGKDIILGITKVMRKFGGSDMKQQAVLDRIASWLDAEKEKNKKRAHGRIEDRAECMAIFARQGATLGEALAYAQHLMNLHSPLKLMTGHKAKGLEFDHVYFLDAKLVGDEDQQPNLRYVIATRAKDTLTYIESKGFSDGQALEAA